MKKPNRFKKVESIKKLIRYDLPIPKTIFIFDFKKQEKEIDNFLKNREIVTIRSDKEGKTDFCPHYLRCPRAKAKKFIKKLTAKDYAVILQAYVFIRTKRISGNILTLKNHILMELMGLGPLTWLNREGRVEERLKFKRHNFKLVEHAGKKLVRRKKLINILRTVKDIPPYRE